MMPNVPLASLVIAGVGSPAVLFALLGGASMINRPLPERWTGRLAAASMTMACAALSVALIVYGTTATGTRLLAYGEWSTSHEGGIAIEFLVDRLSLAFAALSAGIAGVVSAFSNRYLHREPGYNRYFVLLAMFVTGMLLVALAGNVEVLFAGWEFVGLSSALLVAFFHERRAPVSNALRVLTVYRISDAAMLSAAVLLRHVAGTDSLSLLFSGAGAASTAGLDRNQRDHHRRPADRGRRRQECAAAVFELAPPRHGGTHAVERRLLWIALDSRWLLSVVAVGAAARTRARGPPPRRSTRSGDGDLRGDHHPRPERRQVVAGLCGTHTSGHHRGRNRDRLVLPRLRPSGRTRLLSPAAVPERSERSPRSRTGWKTRSATGRLRRAAISSP